MKEENPFATNRTKLDCEEPGCDFIRWVKPSELLRVKQNPYLCRKHIKRVPSQLVRIYCIKECGQSRYVLPSRAIALRDNYVCLHCVLIQGDRATKVPKNAMEALAHSSVVGFPKFKHETCSTCKGSGIDRTSGSSFPCDLCHSKGTIRVPVRPVT